MIPIAPSMHQIRTPEALTVPVATTQAARVSFSLELGVPTEIAPDALPQPAAEVTGDMDQPVQRSGTALETKAEAPEQPQGEITPQVGLATLEQDPSISHRTAETGVNQGTEPTGTAPPERLSDTGTRPRAPAQKDSLAGEPPRVPGESPPALAVNTPRTTGGFARVSPVEQAATRGSIPQVDSVNRPVSSADMAKPAQNAAHAPHRTLEMLAEPAELVATPRGNLPNAVPAHERAHGSTAAVTAGLAGAG